MLSNNSRGVGTMGCKRLLTEIFGTCCLEIHKKIRKHLRRHCTRATKKRIQKSDGCLQVPLRCVYIDFIYAYNSLSSNQPASKTLGWPYGPQVEFHVLVQIATNRLKGHLRRMHAAIIATLDAANHFGQFQGGTVRSKPWGCFVAPKTSKKIRNNVETFHVLSHGNKKNHLKNIS